MSFLKNLFGKKEEPIKSYADFWNWFQNNERKFYDIVKYRSSNEVVEKEFFDKMSPRLGELKDGYYFLTGMADDTTAELIITADGIVENIVFVEELIQQAPEIPGWKFTAFKPSLDIEDVCIQMEPYTFDKDNIHFYSNDLARYPDEIDITVVYSGPNADNETDISNGVYIFLDNYLGELDFVNNIDRIQVISNNDARKELVPIAKLKDFLIWRQKEFIERYDGIRYDTENDEHSILEAELENGNKMIAVINTQLLKWEQKASHPWIAVMTIEYDGRKYNGMPGNEDYEKLRKMEEEITNQLKDKDGYLNIGRQTSDNEREIYFACKDFRKPSKLFHEIQKKYAKQYDIEVEIYKDKYWQSFERFNSAG